MCLQTNHRITPRNLKTFMQCCSWTLRYSNFGKLTKDPDSGIPSFWNLPYPKDHWTLKTGYFEEPTPAIQVQTLPLKGLRILRAIEKNELSTLKFRDFRYRNFHHRFMLWNLTRHKIGCQDLRQTGSPKWRLRMNEASKNQYQTKWMAFNPHITG